MIVGYYNDTVSETATGTLIEETVNESVPIHNCEHQYMITYLAIAAGINHLAAL